MQRTLAVSVRHLNRLRVTWQRNRRSRIELSRMSPRELRDIGLSPAEAETECNKPFWTG